MVNFLLMFRYLLHLVDMYKERYQKVFRITTMINGFQDGIFIFWNLFLSYPAVDFTSTSTWVRDGPLGILSRESPPGAGAGKI